MRTLSHVEMISQHRGMLQRQTITEQRLWLVRVHEYLGQHQLVISVYLFWNRSRLIVTCIAIAAFVGARDIHVGFSHAGLGCGTEFWAYFLYKGEHIRRLVRRLCLHVRVYPPPTKTPLRGYTLPQKRVYRCLTTAISSGSTVLAFLRHVTLHSLLTFLDNPELNYG
jgi:hypothetical protein